MRYPARGPIPAVHDPLFLLYPAAMLKAGASYPWRARLAALIRAVCMLTLLLGAAAVQADKRIALSFDDVPRDAGAFFSPDQRSRLILRHLRTERVPPVVFFVVPGQIGHDDGAGGARRIAAYVAAGNVIANHTFSHPHLADMTAAAYLADVDRAGRWLHGRRGYRPWFRYPYLEEGGTDRAKRDDVRAGLARRGLTNGYVTAESSDWNLDALTVAAAAAHRPIDRRALGQLYVRWHVEAADFADRLMQQAIGRQPAQVLLLHETDLAALYIGDLVRALRADGWTVISADEAYADPLSRLNPDWAVANGTLTEMLARQKGLPAPYRYRYNDRALADAEFRLKVLKEKPRP